ncbi:MAG TPA: hypothetical protein DCO70_02350 [Verrucomicrobiales bacterium]|nr:hypothetical protein [Verrucomicrobiales bacterium]
MVNASSSDQAQGMVLKAVKSAVNWASKALFWPKKGQGNYQIKCNTQPSIFLFYAGAFRPSERTVKHWLANCRYKP